MQHIAFEVLSHAAAARRLEDHSELVVQLMSTTQCALAMNPELACSLPTFPVSVQLIDACLTLSDKAAVKATTMLLLACISVAERGPPAAKGTCSSALLARSAQLLVALLQALLVTAPLNLADAISESLLPLCAAIVNASGSDTSMLRAALHSVWSASKPLSECVLSAAAKDAIAAACLAAGAHPTTGPALRPAKTVLLQAAEATRAATADETALLAAAARL
jgi:hypothetical protein